MGENKSLYKYIVIPEGGHEQDEREIASESIARRRGVSMGE